MPRRKRHEKKRKIEIVGDEYKKKNKKVGSIIRFAVPAKKRKHVQLHKTKRTNTIVIARFAKNTTACIWRLKDDKKLNKTYCCQNKK